MSTTALCTHCHLPVREDAQQREVNGEHCPFCCYGCYLAFQVGRGQGHESEAAWLLIRLGIGTFLSMFIMLFSLLLYADTFSPTDGELIPIVHALLWALSTPVIVILGGPFMRGAWRAARSGRATADTLVSLGALAAFGYSTLQIATGGASVYFDTATMVLVLFTVGRYLEAASRARTARSLAPMLAAERAKATVVIHGHAREQPVCDIGPGTLVRVVPGERVAVDGVVVEGRSQCDEALLTGQHEAQLKTPGVTVYAGSLNGSGQLLVRATGTGAGTRWGQISQFVSAALQRKSLTGEIIDRAAAIFVPAVVVLAGLTLIYWNEQGTFEQALMASLAVLVVACPCALGLAAPLASSLGLGLAAQHGVLVRGGGVLERLGRVNGIAFDKTGTLTAGELRLRHICPERTTEQALLQRAASLAQGSDHAIARGIAREAQSRSIEPLAFDELQTRAGQGIVGHHQGGVTAMGSTSLMLALGWSIPENLAQQVTTTLSGCTSVYIGWDNEVRGVLALTQTLLASAQPVVASLGELGLATCVLSGDSATATAHVAKSVGVGSWEANLSPEAKVSALRDWARLHGDVAMAGDGMNDGPVLATASVGIAVGGATDLARESADVSLPEGALERLPWLIQLARRVRRTIYGNVAWALGYNVAALTLAASGLLLPVIAAALMAGSSLVVVINSLRVGRGGSEPRPPAAPARFPAGAQPS